MKNISGKTVTGKKFTGSNPGNFEPKTLQAMTKLVTPASTNISQAPRVVKFTMMGVPAPNGQTMCVPIVIPSGAANAFRVVDSPVALRIKSDIFSSGLYSMQEGEGCQGVLGSLTVDGFGYNPAPSGVTGNIPASATGAPLFTFKIWLGYSNYIGRIDQRIIPSPQYKERMTLATPATGTLGGVLIANVAAAGLTAFSVDAKPEIPSVINQFETLKEWIVTNLDPNTTIYIASDASVNEAYVAVFPQSSVRVPVSGNYNAGSVNTTQDNFSIGNITILNPSGAAVACLVCGIIACTSQEYESE
jgi:hypothetical protein